MERKELIESIEWVDKVVLTNHEPNPKDMGVSKGRLKKSPLPYPEEMALRTFVI